MDVELWFAVSFVFKTLLLFIYLGARCSSVGEHLIMVQ